MKQLRNFLHSCPVIRRYLSDEQFKFSISLAGSFAGNLLYAVWEMLCGIYYHSYWFVTLGCYYVLLLLARLILLREMYGHREETTEWKRYRACGILLLLMNFILSGIVVLAVIDHQGSHYAGYLIYAMATYTFVKIGTAIRNLVKYRTSHDPVFAVSKVISFVSAVISMLSLEIAMLRHFGTDEVFFKIMTVLTGTGVCIIISATASGMVMAAQKVLRTHDNKS